MINDEETVTRLLQEPANGARLVVQEDEHDFKVIWRDDAEADRWYGESGTDQRWFDDVGTDPMGFYQHVKYAETVWPLGAEPLATFRGVCTS